MDRVAKQHSLHGILGMPPTLLAITFLIFIRKDIRASMSTDFKTAQNDLTLGKVRDEKQLKEDSL